MATREEISFTNRIVITELDKNEPSQRNEHVIRNKETIMNYV